MPSLRDQLRVVRNALFPRPLGCAKKGAYDTEDHVRRVIELRTRPGAINRETAPLYFYVCSVCGKHHITKLMPPDWKQN